MLLFDRDKSLRLTKCEPVVKVYLRAKNQEEVILLVPPKSYVCHLAELKNVGCFLFGSVGWNATTTGFVRTDLEISAEAGLVLVVSR